MADDTKIVAVALLTARDLERLGAGFKRAYPVDETPCFGALLNAIDEADRQIWVERDQSHLIITQVPSKDGSK